MATDVLKKELRSSMAARRQSLTSQQWQTLSLKAQECVLALPEWQAAREVLLYSAFRNETDASLLRDDALARGVRVLLPRCRPDEDGGMDLACISCVEELSPGRYGIPEPDPALCASLASYSPDVAVIPGLAFDRQGNRLGWGGGYYDRFLASPGLRKTLVLGLAFPFQIIETMPSDPWDRPVDLVCTGE